MGYIQFGKQRDKVAAANHSFGYRHYQCASLLLLCLHFVIALFLSSSSVRYHAEPEHSRFVDFETASVQFIDAVNFCWPRKHLQPLRNRKRVYLYVAPITYIPPLLL